MYLYIFIANSREDLHDAEDLIGCLCRAIMDTLLLLNSKSEFLLNLPYIEFFIYVMNGKMYIIIWMVIKNEFIGQPVIMMR